ARLEFSSVVGERAIQKIQRARAADGHFSHMGNIENARRPSHCEMLIGDAGVLHRHFPAAKFDQFAAQLLMRREERCSFHWVKLTVKSRPKPNFFQPARAESISAVAEAMYHP